MDRWSGKVAIVTGASSGIGASISKALVENGVKVVGCARNVQKMDDLAKTFTAKSTGSFKGVKCDVTKEEDILSVFDLIRKEYGALHICVSNAGIGTQSRLLSGKTEDFRSMMDVNVIALVVCAREAVKLMKESGVDNGHIINISSMSAHRVQPGPMHFYAATKHAVKAITIGIKNELRAMGSHIRVTSLSPGLVETEFAQLSAGPDAAAEMYSRMECLKGKDISDLVVYILSSPANVDIHDVLLMPVEQDYSSAVYK